MRKKLEKNNNGIVEKGKVMQATDVTKQIVDILEEHKAEDISLLDVREQIDFADYFIICTGTSDRMLDALADAVIDGIREKYHIHGSVQGVSSGGWLLIDFSDIIVHIFSADKREYYDLETLYSESKTLLKLQ